MFPPEGYKKFKERFKELDRVFDTVVKNSVKMGGTVYVDRKILSSYPQEYLDYYMTTRQIFITPMPAYHKAMRVRDNTLSLAKRYVALNRLARAYTET